MKILYYNWVDYLDDERRGGGVTVYQKNLMQAFGEIDDAECLFLSSGISYDLGGAAPRWAQVRHGPVEDRARRYEIVNSGTLSPSHHSFGHETQVAHDATREVFFDFIERMGPFDVIHFHNLEGLPAEVLSLKERWPETRVILSLHNYYPVCPQVNLWFQERMNCRDFKGGRACIHCLPHQADPNLVRMANAVAFHLKRRGVRPGTRVFDRGFGPAMGLARRGLRLFRRLRRSNANSAPAQLPSPSPSNKLRRVEAPQARFARRRAIFTELVNTYCDRVLCVSDRVGEVAARFGVAPALLETSYIGTRHAEKFAETRPATRILGDDGTLTIAYLGYMRRDKGFFFLLDALEALPSRIAQQLRVVICSKLIDHHVMNRISALSDRFASVLFADGYSHDDLDELLEGVGLGVIPVLWEDNLPQVAIEMHARHIPLLTSDLGGAQELGSCSDLVFKAGDVTDFARKLDLVLSNGIDLDAYWSDARAPASMAAHVDELRAIYARPSRAIETMKARPEPAEPDEENE